MVQWDSGKHTTLENLIESVRVCDSLISSEFILAPSKMLRMKVETSSLPNGCPDGCPEICRNEQCILEEFVNSRQLIHGGTNLHVCFLLEAAFVLTRVHAKSHCIVPYINRSCGPSCSLYRTSILSFHGRGSIPAFYVYEMSGTTPRSNYHGDDAGKGWRKQEQA